MQLRGSGALNVGHSAPNVMCSIIATHIATFHKDFLSTFYLAMNKGQQWVFFGAFP